MKERHHFLEISLQRNSATRPLKRHEQLVSMFTESDQAKGSFFSVSTSLHIPNHLFIKSKNFAKNVSKKIKYSFQASRISDIGGISI